MNVSVNSKETVLTLDCTISQLTESLKLPLKGIAIAVNNHMIPRGEWETYSLQENDQLVIIQAACGG